MKKIKKALSLIFALVLLMCCFPSEIVASAAKYDWVGSWGSPAVESGVVLGESLHMQDYIPAGSTIRTVLTPTLSGSKIRLKFSNLYGQAPLTINEVTVAQTGSTDDMVDGSTITQVTFNGGHKDVTIAPGSEIFSDEINFQVTALKKISVSSYYKNTTTMYTTGLYNAKTYLASSLGNRTHKEGMTVFATKFQFTSGAITYTPIPFLTRLDVYAQDAYSVVIIGDSTVTNEIPLMLAEKLHKNGITNVGFVMSGIIGNELLNDGTGLLGKIYGESMLDRARRDAFDVAGVKYVIVKIGVNDVLHPMLDSNQGKVPLMQPSQVIKGYRDLAQMAFGKGVKMYLCTRTPYKGYERAFMGSKDLTWTQQGENTLLEINSWVKNSSTSYNYAGYIDLDAVRDPQDSAKLRSQMTSDGVHFTRYGQIAITDLIPEEAYGVNKELKDYAKIVNVDPYKAPAAAETTTKAPETTTKAPETTTKAPEATTSSQQQAETTTNLVPGIIATPETTTLSNANQIFLEDPNGTDGSVTGNVADLGSNGMVLMAIFAVLATFGMAMIAVSAFMLSGMKPAGQGSLIKGGNGRAKQKKRV